MDLNYIKEYYYIDTSSPSGLRCAKDTYSGNRFKRKMKSAGDVAGFQSAKNDYWQIYVNGKYTFVHRIIMFLVDPSMSDDCIVDHVDGDPSNNNPANLRKTDKSTNAKNQRKYKSNSSGVTGVCWQTKKGTLFAVARWQISSGKTKDKYFNSKTLGLLPAFYFACLYRKQRIAELNHTAEGGYTDRHGL